MKKLNREQLKGINNLLKADCFTSKATQKNTEITSYGAGQITASVVFSHIKVFVAILDDGDIIITF